MFEKALRQNLGTDIIRAHTKQMFLPDIKVWLFFCLVFLFPLPEVNILNKIFVFNEEKKKKLWKRGNLGQRERCSLAQRIRAVGNNTAYLQRDKRGITFKVRGGQTILF